MQSSVEKLSETRVKLTVEVPFSELDNEIKNAYQAIAGQINIPGFRPGKAPRQLIDARVGRGPILEQVVNDMLPSRYEAAVAENDLNPLGQPDIEITKLEDGELVEFTAAVDVRPEITVPDFSAISVEVPALQDSEEDVTARIDALRERFGELSDTKRKLKTNDFAVIDLVAEVDGEEVEDSKSEGLSYQVGANDLIKGLDTALRGMKTGEDNEFTTTLEQGEHAGKEATVKVHVQQTKERKLPELNDEFVQEASEFDTVAELEESTKKEVEQIAKSNQAAAIRDEFLKAALSQTEFEVPEGVVAEQADAQIQQVLAQVGGDEAMLASLLEAQGTSREEFDKDAREGALESVRTQLFLDAVADELNPEVSQQEVTDHILFTAQSYGMDPSEFIMQLQQSGQIANLFADVRRGKALAAAICQATVTDDAGETVDVEEYFGEENSEVSEEASE